MVSGSFTRRKTVSQVELEVDRFRIIAFLQF